MKTIERFKEKLPEWHKKSAPFDCWEAFDEYNSFIEKFITEEIKKALKEQMDEFLNQPMNQHDQMLRDKVRKEIIEWVEKNKIYYGGRIPNEEFCVDEKELINYLKNK